MGGRILIADDDPDDLELLSADLKTHGYQVVCCTDGNEALSTAKSVLPDLVILDILMPGLQGNEVGRALGAEPATRKIPVIYLTGLKALSDVGEGVPVGSITISKPLNAKDYESIRLVIRRVLSGERA